MDFFHRLAEKVKALGPEAKLVLAFLGGLFVGGLLF